jgi:hypothetical protein
MLEHTLSAETVLALLEHIRIFVAALSLLANLVLVAYGTVDHFDFRINCLFLFFFYFFGWMLLLFDQWRWSRFGDGLD